MEKIFRERRFRCAIPFIILAFVALIGFVVMTLWNNLLPEILNVSTITFWQALGIFILCKILFGFGGRGGKMGPPWMRGRMEERLKQMSPEQREKFRQQMEDRMCGWKRRSAAAQTDEENATINPS